MTEFFKKQPFKRRKISKLKLMKNIFTLKSDTWLAVFGVMFGVLVSFFSIHDHYPYKNIIQIVALLAIAFFAFFITYKLAKKDSHIFPRIISNDVGIDILVREISRQSQTLIKSLHPIDDESILFKNIAKARSQVEIIESIKKIAAERLGVSSDAFCEHFIQFNPRVYLERQSERALNLFANIQDTNYLNKLTTRTNANDDLGETNPKNSDQTNCAYKEVNTANISIQEYSQKSLNHLIQVEQSDLDYQHFKYLFSARSTIDQMLNLVLLIQSAHKNNVSLDLLYQLQKTHHNGNTLSRLIALSIIGSRYFMNHETYNFDLWERQFTFLAQKEVNPIANQGTSTIPAQEVLQTSEALANNKGPTANYLSKQDIKNWSVQINYLLDHLIRDVAIELLKELNPLYEKSDSKVFLFVIGGYSLTVLYAIRFLHSSTKINNFKIFLIDENKDLGSKYTQHLLTMEDEDKSILREKLTVGTLKELSSILDSKEQDYSTVIYLTGCEYVVKNNKQEKVIATTEHPEIFHFFLDRNENIDEKYRVFVLAGIYKHILSLLRIKENYEKAVQHTDKYTPGQVESNFNGLFLQKVKTIITNNKTWDQHDIRSATIRNNDGIIERIPIDEFN